MQSAKKWGKVLMVRGKVLSLPQPTKNEYETARSNNQAQRAFNGDRQTRIRACAENVATAPGPNPAASRRNVGLLSVHDNEGGKWKGYYLGDGIQTVRQAVRRIAEGGPE